MTAVLDGVDRTSLERSAADRSAPDRSAPDRSAQESPAPDRSAADRAALARAALARAEQRTGARSGLRLSTRPPTSRPGASSASTPPSTAPARTSPAATSAATSAAAPSTAVRPADGPATGAVAPATTGSITHPDRPPLPVAPALASLLPEGALRRGSSLVVTGSTSLVLALVATASQEGSWVAVVGLPRVGLLAAQQSGVVLDRLALVPRPGPDAPTVVAALLDGVDLVVVGDDAALVDSDRRRLTARARERGTVLLSTTPWQGANVVLTAEPVEWTGLGPGHGHLRRHRLAVTRGGRGSAGRGASAEVVLPLRPEAAGTRPGAAPGRRPVAAPAVPLRMVG